MLALWEPHPTHPTLGIEMKNRTKSIKTLICLTSSCLGRGGDRDCSLCRASGLPIIAGSRLLQQIQLLVALGTETVKTKRSQISFLSFCLSAGASLAPKPVWGWNRLNGERRGRELNGKGRSMTSNCVVSCPISCHFNNNLTEFLELDQLLWVSTTSILPQNFKVLSLYGFNGCHSVISIHGI